MLKISWNLLELYIEQYVQTTKQGMKNEKKMGKKRTRNTDWDKLLMSTWTRNFEYIILFILKIVL